MLRNPTPNNKRVTTAGQAMTEYVLLVCMVMMALVGTVGVFMGGIAGFYMNIVKVVTLPFP